MLPPALVSALALHLGAEKVLLLLLSRRGPSDSDLALLHNVCQESRLGVNILETPSFDESVAKSLVIDLYGESLGLKDGRFFYPTVHWVADELNLDAAPDLLRLDSSFFVPTLTSNGSWILKDIYKLSPNLGRNEGKTLINDPVGSWSPSYGINIPAEIWDRRHLHGLPLRVTTVPNTRFVWDYNHDGTYSGLIVDIVERMEASSNFSANWIVPSDGAYGSKNQDGSWNGMVGLLAQGEVDMSAALLSVSLSRSEVISYAHPYVVTKSTLMGTAETFKSSGRSFNFTGYLSVFTLEAWTSLLVVLSLDVVAFVIFLKKNHANASFGQTLAKSLVAVAETIVKLGLSYNPRRVNVSGRTLLWTAAMFPVIIMSYYEGLLTSYLTIKTPPPVFKSIADILITGHKIVLVKDSMQLEQFRKSPSNSARRKVYEALIEGNDDALVENTTLMNQITANDSRTVGVASLIEGDVTPEGLYGLMGLDEAIPDPLAFALQKDSEYLGLINHNMIRMYQSGVLEFIKSKWLGLRTPDSTCRDIYVEQNARYFSLFLDRDTLQCLYSAR